MTYRQDLYIHVYTWDSGGPVEAWVIHRRGRRAQCRAMARRKKPLYFWGWRLCGRNSINTGVCPASHVNILGTFCCSYLCNALYALVVALLLIWLWSWETNSRNFSSLIYKTETQSTALTGLIFICSPFYGRTDCFGPCLFWLCSVHAFLFVNFWIFTLTPNYIVSINVWSLPSDVHVY